MQARMGPDLQTIGKKAVMLMHNCFFILVKTSPTKTSISVAFRDQIMVTMVV
jgi:hypothetical protein